MKNEKIDNKQEEHLVYKHPTYTVDINDIDVSCFHFKYFSRHGICHILVLFFYKNHQAKISSSYFVIEKHSRNTSWINEQHVPTFFND